MSYSDSHDNSIWMLCIMGPWESSLSSVCPQNGRQFPTKRTTWDLQPEMAMSMITFGLGGENVTDQVLAEFPDGLSRGKGPCNQITLLLLT